MVCKRSLRTILSDFFQNLKSIFFGDFKYVLRKAGPYLPIGIYLVDEEGYFQYCNEVCREILGISCDEKVDNLSIRNFYLFPERRDELLEKLKQKGGFLQKQPIQFKKRQNDTIITVEDCCRVHQGRFGKKYYVGSLTDITEESHYREMFDDLPSGVFRVNNDHKFVTVNRAVAKIFGFEDPDQLIRRDVREFWKNKQKYNQYLELVNKEKQVINFHARMTRRDRKNIHISINAKLWIGEDGKVLGREGTFTDVTNEIKYSQSFEKFSIGYYEVHYEDGKHTIVKCNDTYAKMHGYHSREDVIGQDIMKFHADPTQKEIFLKTLRNAEISGGNIVNNIRLKAKKKDGTAFWVQVDFSIERDAAERVIGRQGIVVDIDERMKLQEEVNKKEVALSKTLRDMDRFVHQYIAPLMSVDSTAQTLFEILEHRLRFSIDKINAFEIDHSTTWKLIEKLEVLLEKIEQEERKKDFVREVHGLKQKLVFGKQQYLQSDLSELLIREIIFDMLKLANRLERNFAKLDNREFQEELNEIRQEIKEIYDTYIMQLLRRILNSTKITNNVIESLRRYLFSGEEAEFEFTKTNIINIIKENIAMYFNLAKQKGLTIVPPKQNYVMIEISVPHVDRMLSNLIQNAIKYSYHRKGGFVDIRLFEQRNLVIIEIVNYGVPVEREEIDRLFEFGYRGKHSFDWNRTGSGIGLADAKKTVEKHGGDIHIKSEPMDKGESMGIGPRKGRKKPPYLTTVTVILPKRREKK
ncbi:MAG: PAS domain S-box protein [Calditrichaeota bacterium]|nr:PAS domain S-box protein [Calditrichota bacterium]